MVGLALEASGCQAAVGDVCDMLNGDGSRCEAEVVGFAGDKLFLMPTGEVPRLRARSCRSGTLITAPSRIASADMKKASFRTGRSVLNMSMNSGSIP